MMEVNESGTPIAVLTVIDKKTGEETEVYVQTCAEAVTCPDGTALTAHLLALDNHAKDAAIHLTADEKAGLETKQGAQDKATAAQNAAYIAASLLVQAVKNEAAADATSKVNSAVASMKSYTDWKARLLENHVSNGSNPHGVTAAQVGLDKVPNKATNDITPTYTQAGTLSQLSSGEKLSIAFGKIAKAISSLISHIGNKENPHNVTAKQSGALPTTGGTMTGTLAMGGGHITLTRGKNYGTADEIPEDLPEGGLFLKVVD
jgi:hypothetical protein